MAKAKTQIVNTPSLFDVFDYYNEQGDLQNEPRYSDQNGDRRILRDERESAGVAEARSLSNRTGAADLQSTIERGRGEQTASGVGENLQLGEIRPSGSTQRSESVLHTNTRESTNGLQLGEQNVGYDNPHTNQRDTKDSQLSSINRSGWEMQQGRATLLESSSDSKMGEARARENRHNERRGSLVDNATTSNNGARSDDESLSYSQLRESNTLSSTSGYGDRSQSIPTQSPYSLLVADLNQAGLNSKEAFRFLDYLEQNGYARFNESSDSYEITHILSFDLQNDTTLQNTFGEKFAPLLKSIKQMEQDSLRQIATQNASKLTIDDLKPFPFEKIDKAWNTIVCEQMFGEMPRYFDNTKHFENLKDEFYEKNPVANTFFIGDRLFTFGGNTLFELPQESVKKYFDVDLNVQSTSAYEMFAKGIENFTPKNEFYKESQADISVETAQKIAEIDRKIDGNKKIIEYYDREIAEIDSGRELPRYKQAIQNEIDEIHNRETLDDDKEKQYLQDLENRAENDEYLEQKLQDNKQFFIDKKTQAQQELKHLIAERQAIPSVPPYKDLDLGKGYVARDVEIPIETSLDTQQQKVDSSVQTPKTQEPRWATQTLDFSDGVPKVKDITPLVSQASLKEIDSALDNNAKELGLQVEANSSQESTQIESKPKNTTPSNQQDKALAIPKVVATQSSLNIHNMRKSSEVPSLVPEKDLVYQGSDTNYKLDSSNALPMSKKDRVEANLAAIKVAKHIERERMEKGDYLGLNIIPNEAQKEVLSKYSGWGGLREFFYPNDTNGFFYNKNAEFQKILLASSVDYKTGKLDSNLAYSQYEKARKSADDAFYTPKFIIDSLYQGLEHFGLNNDKQANDGVRDIFEPSLGVGKFIGFSPNEKYKFHGSEIDPISSSIAQMLYPESRIENKGYEAVNPNRQYDAFIGNPPYDNFKLYHKKIGNKVICDFFIEKTMLNLKDDGIAAFVVSHNFLDKEDSRNRAAIAKNATFLGAIRLPSSAFKDSHTEVISDIVFFKKGADTNLDWVKASPLVLESGKETRAEYLDPKDRKVKVSQVCINDYFAKNKDKVLGILDVGSGEFGLELKCHENKGLDLSAAISEAIATMPKDVYKYHETIYSYKSHMLDSSAPQFNEVKAYLDSKKIGNLVEIDGEVLLLKESINRGSNYKLATIDDDLGVRGKPKDRLRDFIRLRDDFNALIALEQSDISDDDMALKSARLQLNQTYDKFIKDWGFLNSRDNRSLFRKFDCEANKILGLEKAYDKGLSKKMAAKENPPVEPRKPSATKADIFENRVIRPRAIQKIETPKDAYLMSLALYGRVDTTFIDGSLPNMDFKDIMEDLKNQKLVFENHRFSESNTSETRSASEIEQDLTLAKNKLDELLKEKEANSQELLYEKMKEMLLARDGIEYDKDSVVRFNISPTGIQLMYETISGHKTYYLFDDDFTKFAAETQNAMNLERGEQLIDVAIEAGQKEIASLEAELQESKNTIEIKQESEAYLSANVYLSGNVKEKLKELEYLVANGRDDLAPNLEAMKEVIPKDIKAVDIGVNFGAAWIELKYYEEFLLEKVLESGANEKSLEVSLDSLKEMAIWVSNRDISSEAAKRYTTEKMDITSAIKHARNNTAPIFKKPSGKYDKYGEPILVTDNEATQLARDKIDELKRDFGEWIFRDMDRREHLEQVYNDTFNTNVPLEFDGSHIDKLEGFSDTFTLYPHQKDAIMAGIQTRSLLLDHQVGAGKTLSTICTLMEQKRIGLINKPLVIVPNHILEQWNRDFHNAYPNANVLVADKDSFDKNGREAFFSKVASNDWDCVIMTHSQVQNIPLPMQYFEKYIYEQKQELERILNDVDKDGGTKRQQKAARKRITDQIANLEKDLNKQRESQTDSIDFSELGIDSVVVDESQEFKNLSVKTKMQNVLGLGTAEPSMKAQKLLSITSYLHDNDKRVMFLTGTPISNSLTEIYTLQRYLQPELLKEKGINTFDKWASVFGNPTNDFELDSSGVNYKMVTRFSELQNMPELSTMYKSNAHIITNEDILKVFPEFVPQIRQKSNGERSPEIVTTPRSDDVSFYMGVQDDNGKYNEGSIIWRMDNFKENPRRNNMLAVTTDARKAGLDYRLINPNAEVDDEHSKSSDMVKNIINEYRLWDKDKGTQLVFCNLSTPTCKSQSVDVNSDIQIKDEGLNAIMNADSDEAAESKSLSQDELIAQEQKFDVYSDVLKKLVKAGIPQKEIAFIHDATTDIQKRDLFDKVNRGDIRVLIGSTFKMGAGTNVQERIVALHSLDCPWRPSDLAQGDGRAIRQGNALHKKYGHDDFAISIYRYATEQTYDARMWQSIEFKAKGIEAFKNGCKDPTQRTLDDVSMGSASAAEMKAAATGNPLFLTQQQIKAELRKEENRERAFKRDLFGAQEKLKTSIAYTPLFEKELNTLKDIKNTLDSNPKGEVFMCECFDGEKFNTIQIDDGKTPKERELDSSIKAVSKELDSLTKAPNEAQSKQTQELQAKLDSLKLERAELLYPNLDKLKEAANELNPRSSGEAKRFIDDFIKPLESKMDKNALDSLATSLTQKAQENAKRALTLSGASDLEQERESKKSVQEKAFEAMFWKNFDNAFESGADEVAFFKYRGLLISGAFNDRLDEFSLSITDGKGKNYIEPENLIYTMNRGNIFENNWRSKISFNGLWRRINNFCNDIDKQIATQENAIMKNGAIIKDLQEQVKNGEYPNKEYLAALRDDDKQVLIEINKSALNKHYKSSFEPKSTQIKAAQAKARREAALQELNGAER